MTQAEFDAAYDAYFEWLPTIGTPGLGGGDMTGDLGIAPEVDVASAATCDIGAANSNKVNITGTTTITSFGTHANRLKLLRFSGSLTLTHDGTSLILPGGTNITTVAGDTCLAISDASGNWRIYGYQRSMAEGAYTPVLDLSTAGTSSFSSTNSGYYKRSGNRVEYLFGLSFTPTIGTGSGNLEVSLPVPAGASSFALTAGAINQLSASFTGLSSRYMVVPALLSATKMGFSIWGQGAGTSALGSGNLTDGGAHAMRGHLIYFTDI